MLALLLVICAGSALADYQPIDIEDAEQLFEQFIEDYNKNYLSREEKQRRLEIFKENLLIINEHNDKYNEIILGINRFADLSKEEFEKHYHGCVSSTIGVSNCTQLQNRRLLNRKAPESFDWRDQGAVTSVKNQAHCGSCWAFSAVANIESQYAIKHKELLDLSEQQPVDCDNYGCGCEGGRSDSAIVNVMELNGLMFEEDYPYTAKNGNLCLHDPKKKQVQVTGCLDFTGTEEEDIKEVLYNYGPLTIALGASSWQLKHYKGIFKECSPIVDHALLVVGYGTDEKTKEPYWIIKNSWAEDWGDKGYLKLLRGIPDCRFGQEMLVTSVVA